MFRCEKKLVVQVNDQKRRKKWGQRGGGGEIDKAC